MAAAASKSRAGLAWLWSLVNSMMLVGILAALPLAGFSDSTIVACSVWVASMQAAQAVVVQNGSLNASVVALGIVGISVSAGIFVLVQWGLVSNFWVISLAGASGVLFGLVSGGTSVPLLSSGNPRAFQFKNAVRSLCISVAGAFSILAEVAIDADFVGAFVLATGMAALVLSLTTRRKPIAGVRPGYSPKAVLVIVAGLGASLLYRNDVNLLRGHAPPDLFMQWHYAFLAYSLFQGFLGLVVTNHLFSRREKAREQMLARIAKNSRTRTALAGISVVLVLAALAVPSIPVVVSLVLALVISMVVQFVSSYSHVSSLSIVPYVSGAVGFLFLLIAIENDVSTSTAWAIELSVILGIQVLVLVVAGRTGIGTRRGGVQAL